MTIRSEEDAKGPDFLAKYEDNWCTFLGACFPGEGERVVLRGKDLFSELNNLSWMEYLVYAVTGKQSPKLATLIEGLWAITTSYPDPRLWNNRIAALAGTTRSTGVLATAAGIAASEATIYGSKPIKGALDFLYRASAKMKNGHSIEQIVREELRKHRAVYGFGRPMVNQDERISPVLAFLETIGVPQGRFVRLAFELDDYFKSTRYNFRMNIAALNAAIMADQGLMPQEYYHLAILAFSAGIIPCYVDSIEKPEGALFPISVSRINYSGSTLAKRWGKLK